MIPAEWIEAKIIKLHKEGDMKDIKKITGVSVYFGTYANCSHGHYKNKNQPREQAGCKKGYSAIDHLQTINQLIEKCNEFKRPLFFGYSDYDKAFHSIKHESVFKALRSIGIEETCITILLDIYTGATARVHVDDQVSKQYQY